MTIEPSYITFEQAKLLKELGFDVPTQCAFDENGKDFIDEHWSIDYNDASVYHCYSKPQQWQVVEWLRVVKGIYVCWTPTFNPKKFQFRLYRNDNGTMTQIYNTFMGKNFSCPQKAYSAAFDHILPKLKKER